MISPEDTLEEGESETHTVLWILLTLLREILITQHETSEENSDF